MGKFHLYLDISKFAMGSALYQIQSRKSKLIAYTSKRSPEAAKNYSIIELEMCGLIIVVGFMFATHATGPTDQQVTFNLF